MANKKLLVAAAKKFIYKVEHGQAYSTVTYNELKQALETEETNTKEK